MAYDNVLKQIGTSVGSEFKAHRIRIESLETANTVTNDTTTNLTFYPTFIAETANQSTSIKVSSTKLQYNPSTGTLSTTNMNSLSDIRLKENVVPILYGTRDILRTNPVHYDWKDGSGHSFGFIAQELEEIFPDAVSTNEDGIKSVNYPILTAVLFNSIKELKTEIDTLKAELNSK